ncbi:ABC transporter ATP-binding protein [Allostreptomyces psammosilenae]|nr:ABC transporter ATP-binding protein [Allostreptomyces psammosilenae]
MRYGSTDVLHGVDLDVHAGEVLALLGPNGAGKTTTIEILEGFRHRSAGDVSVLGEDPARAGDAWRGRIGIVMQSWQDHPRWRVRELLEHIAGYYPDPRDPAELLELVGLTELADRQTRRLSGGQRRRLDLALGIVGRPRVVFLDEPTAGLDPVARRAFHELVTRLAEEDTGVLLTTHDLAEAERLADRIAILLDGRIAVSGSGAELAAQVRADAEVSWTAPDGTARTERTAEPSELVWRLHQEFAGPVPDLQVRRPTLEESYLSLVGASGARNQDVPPQAGHGRAATVTPEESR